MADDYPVPETRVLAVASHVRNPALEQSVFQLKRLPTSRSYLGLSWPAPVTARALFSLSLTRNVGNKIAVFVLQSLGLDVCALNTVQFSEEMPPILHLDQSCAQSCADSHMRGNHTGYRQWKGSKVSAGEIADLFAGLKQSHLDDFDMMLTGYIPGAPAVEAVGQIARELQGRTQGAPGSFFWVLDPVMGDNGKLYVAEDVVPAYRSLVPHADLILPNQFEAE
jgi:pyridoxine kinase